MKLTITLNDKETQRLDRAVDLSGLRSRAELVRYLITQYLNDFYGTSDEQRVEK